MDEKIRHHIVDMKVREENLSLFKNKYVDPLLLIETAISLSYQMIWKDI